MKKAKPLSGSKSIKQWHTSTRTPPKGNDFGIGVRNPEGKSKSISVQPIAKKMKAPRQVV